MEVGLEKVKADKRFVQKFDLIVASSVCSFLPQFDTFLEIAKFLMKNSGIFVQWDWEKKEKEQQNAFTPDELRTAYGAAGLKERFIGQAFSVSGPTGESSILMGMASK